MNLPERTTHTRLAIEIVSGKWRLAILYLLSGGPLRTSQIQRALEDVSPKVLTQTLRGLESDGLVERRAHAVVPPRVEYRLTAIAGRLIAALDPLCRWAGIHAAEIVRARTSGNVKSLAVRAASGNGPGQRV